MNKKQKRILGIVLASLTGLALLVTWCICDATSLLRLLALAAGIAWLFFIIWLIGLFDA